MDEADPYEREDVIRGARRSRRSKRGNVFPIDEGGDPTSVQRHGSTSHTTRRRRKRRRRRRTPVTGFELLIGFALSWMVFVCSLMLLELASNSEWFFVTYTAEPTLSAGSWIIGDTAFLSDGRVVDLKSIEVTSDPIGDHSGTRPVVPLSPEVHWGRLGVAMLSGPLLAWVLSAVYRRVHRRRQEEG